LIGQQFALSVDIGMGRAIQINGVFMKEDDEAAINRQLDKLWNACERMRDKVSLMQYEDEIRADKRKMQDTELAYQAAFAEAEKFVRIGKHVPDRLKVDAETHIKAMQAEADRIRAKEETMAALRRKMGNGLGAL